MDVFGPTVEFISGPDDPSADYCVMRGGAARCLTSIAKPGRLLYGSDYAWTRREHVLRPLTSLDVTFDVRNAGWRSRISNNANVLLAQGR
jgi:hypothetical protein